MTFRSSLATVALCLGLVLTGCDLVNDINDPQAITPGQALDTIEGYEALLVQGYDALQAEDHYGQQFMLAPDALADNIRVPNSTSNRYPAFVQNLTGTHLNRWGGHYQSINAMNIIIEGIDELEDESATQANRDQVKGEAYFLRALNYFDLARTKGYEPGREVDGFDLSAIIRTEPTEDLESADFRERSTNDEVYALVLSDLDQAASLLNGNERSTNSPAEFATYAAVLALQARANLYLRNWSAAESAAEDALSETAAMLVQSDSEGDALVSAWAAPTHPESIFEVQFTASTDGDVTNVNASLQSLTDPTRPGGSFTDALPTDDLIAAHEDGDARLALYADAVIGTGDGAEDVQYIQKYTGTSGLDVDRSPVLRVAEMYLILAEARAEQGDTGGARDALNTLRNARGLDDLDSGNLIDQVYQERRVELAFEGHRFFDLKRRGLDVPKPQTAFSVLPYSDFRIIAPLPQTEVNESPVLTQNPGYAG